LSVTAGTLNPHVPKRTIASMQILGWLNEPEGEMADGQSDNEATGSPSSPARRRWTAGEQKKIRRPPKSREGGRRDSRRSATDRQAIYARLQRLDIKRRKAARRRAEKAKGGLK
jgi:hypothetical protein